MLQLPPDPYKILGIAADATLADIRAAHRKLVKQCHPDKVSAEASDDEKRAKEDEFKRVQKAYELLIDDNARANYDDKVKMHKKYMAAKSMANAAAAFASPPRRSETWSPGGPGINPHIHTAEPRHDTYQPRSPPRDVPRQHHRSSREFDEPPRANVKVERDAPPKVRRGPSYEAHRSPTEDVARTKEEELKRKLEEVKRELEKEKEKAARQAPASSDREKEKKPSKTEKSRSEKSRKEEKSSRSSKKDKDVYVEDPDEPNKSSKSKSSSKSTQRSSHRSTKHRDRSSSRSVSRPRRPTKKTSREKAHLEPEVEEPDDTESDIPHDEKFQDKYEAALAYQRQAGGRRGRDGSDLKRAYTEGTLPQVPSAPTPPPMANPAGPKPIIIDAKPSSRPSGQAGSPPNNNFQSPPRGISRAHTMPHQGSYTSRVSIGPDADSYFSSPGGRGRSRSRLAQGFYADDDEPEMSGGQRPRRGSSNAYHTTGYTAESGGSSRMYTVRENPAAYYDNNGAAYYPSSGHSPKGYSVPIHGGPPSGARVVMPFNKMSTAKSYTYDDVRYADVPHTPEDYPGGYVHA